MTRLIQAWRTNFPGTDPKVISDIGANIGHMTQELAEAFPHSEMYSYEPVPVNYDRLVNSCSRFSNVKFFNSGLWVENTKKMIGISDQRESNNVGLFSLLHPEGQLSQEIDLLDIKQLKERPELVKLDVEGVEYELLKEGKEYFFQTKLLFYEHLPEGHANYNPNLELIPELLKEYGFIAFDEIANHNITYIRK